MTITVRHAHQTAIPDDPNYDVGADEWNADHVVEGAVREVLEADRTYYVRSDGSDSNTGTANTAGGAFLTIQHAFDVIAGLDFDIYNVTLSIGAGTFQGGAIQGPIPGYGGLTITGAGVGSTFITCEEDEYFAGFTVVGAIGGQNPSFSYSPKFTGGFTMNASSGGGCRYFYFKNNAIVEVTAAISCPGKDDDTVYEMTQGAQCLWAGAITIGATGVGQICYLHDNSYCRHSAALTLTSTPNIDHFGFGVFDVEDRSYLSVTLSSVTGTGTGSRFFAANNSFFRTTSHTVNTLPGSTPGVSDMSSKVEDSSGSTFLGFGLLKQIEIPTTTYSSVIFSSWDDFCDNRYHTANGTRASPTVLTSGDAMATLSFRGWNGSAYGIGANLEVVARDTWSGSARGTSVDLLVTSIGGSTGRYVLSVEGSTNFKWGQGTVVGWTSNNQANAGTFDTMMIRKGAANIALGAADAAAPVAQTLSVQNVVAGTSNTAGVDFTISGSRSTGTGVGGGLVFQTAAAGGSGSSQNSLTTRMTITGTGNMVATGGMIVGQGANEAHTTTGQIIAADQSSPRIGMIASTSGSQLNFNLDGIIQFRSGSALNTGSVDLTLRRAGAATFQLGAADAASPVAQTLSVQNVVAGTSNTAGATFTLKGSASTGNADGGAIKLQLAVRGSSGTSQNSFVDAFTLQTSGTSAVGLTMTITSARIQFAPAATAYTQFRDYNNAEIFNIGPTAEVGSWSILGTGTSETIGLLRGSATAKLAFSTSELTIASGAITVTGVYHNIDTQSDDATDDLDTINGGHAGMILIIRPNNAGRTVVVKDGTGNIQCAGDFSMDNTQDTMILIFDSTLSAWLEISRSDNGA